MEITQESVRNIVLILHFIGMASLLGGIMVQLKDIFAGRGKVVAAMVHGSWTMLVTGLLLVAVIEWRKATGEDIDLNNFKVAVKSIIVVAVVFLVMFYRKREAVKRGEMLAIAALTLTNITIAVVL